MNPNRKKNAIYSLVLVIALVSVWWYRNHNEQANLKQRVEIVGETMGTTYSIKYLQNEGRNYKASIDSLLELFNQSLSTYIPTSEISQFNQGTVFKFELPFFYPVLKRSYEIYKDTDGAFDPTVGPLVNAWGFGPVDEDMPAREEIDSLLQLVKFDSLYFDSISVCKLKRNIQLDFSAIAKGYGVDVVVDFLKSKGIVNMMVEIGGEMVCLGRNHEGRLWRIGIDRPSGGEGARPLQAVVALENKALATSGNYRNYYEKDGKKFSHTIDPKTGYPVEHTLLSASVFAPDCMTADAYATAFMVMGMEGAKNMLEHDKDLEAYLIYSDERGEVKTFISEGMREFIEE